MKIPLPRAGQKVTWLEPSKTRDVSSSLQQLFPKSLFGFDWLFFDHETYFGFCLDDEIYFGFCARVRTDEPGLEPVDLES